ncbi:hypothetical protein WDV76_14560 [Xenorhabdus griffiniae]|uniref:hypothetical protein n=1 Tax=Xenorhabdus griffiniae TaxID=351672 RepID=UPI0030D44F19
MFERSDNQVTPPGDQRPEHVRSAFTTDLNPALLKVTAFHRHFLAEIDLFRLFFNPLPDNRLMP